jgi:hypothetical protein
MTTAGPAGGINPDVYCARVSLRYHDYRYANNYEIWDGHDFIPRTTAAENEKLQPVFHGMQSGTVFYTKYFENVKFPGFEKSSKEDPGVFVFIGCNGSRDSKVRIQFSPSPSGPWIGEGWLVDLELEDTNRKGPKTDIIVQLPFCRLNEGLLTISFTDSFLWRVHIVEISLEMAISKLTNDPLRHYSQNDIPGVRVLRAVEENNRITDYVEETYYTPEGNLTGPPKRPTQAEVQQIPTKSQLAEISICSESIPVFSSIDTTNCHPVPKNIQERPTLAARRGRKGPLLTIMPCPPGMLIGEDDVVVTIAPIPVPAGGVLHRLAVEKMQSKSNISSVFAQSPRMQELLDAIIADTNSRYERRKYWQKKKEDTEKLIKHIISFTHQKVLQLHEEDRTRESIIEKIKNVKFRNRCREVCWEYVSSQRREAIRELKYQLPHMQRNVSELGQILAEEEYQTYQNENIMRSRFGLLCAMQMRIQLESRTPAFTNNQIQRPLSSQNSQDQANQMYSLMNSDDLRHTTHKSHTDKSVMSTPTRMRNEQDRANEMYSRMSFGECQDMTNIDRAKKISMESQACSHQDHVNELYADRQDMVQRMLSSDAAIPTPTRTRTNDDRKIKLNSPMHPQRFQGLVNRKSLSKTSIRLHSYSEQDRINELYVSMSLKDRQEMINRKYAINSPMSTPTRMHAKKDRATESDTLIDFQESQDIFHWDHTSQSSTTFQSRTDQDRINELYTAMSPKDYQDMINRTFASNSPISAPASTPDYQDRSNPWHSSMKHEELPDSNWVHATITPSGSPTINDDELFDFMYSTMSPAEFQDTVNKQNAARIAMSSPLRAEQDHINEISSAMNAAQREEVIHNRYPLLSPHTTPKRVDQSGFKTTYVQNSSPTPSEQNWINTVYMPRSKASGILTPEQQRQQKHKEGNGEDEIYKNDLQDLFSSGSESGDGKLKHSHHDHHNFGNPATQSLYWQN